MIGSLVAQQLSPAAQEQFYKQKWESIRSAQAQNAQQREKAKAVREQTRHGLMEQKRHGRWRQDVLGGVRLVDGKLVEAGGWEAGG
eukprot:Skav206091  [mRNA]  locus=scaffold2150:204747:205818:+ [translate_table: standard]